MGFDFTDHMYTLAYQQHIHQLSGLQNRKVTKIDQENFEFLGKEIHDLLNVLPNRSDLLVEIFTNKPNYLQQAESILNAAQRISYVSKNLLKLKIKVLEYTIGGMRDFKKGEIIINEIDDLISTSNIDLEPYDKAMLLIDKGFFEAAYKTNYALSAKLTEQGLAILNQHKSTDEEKLRATINLYQDYILRGIKNTAQQWLIKATDLYKSSKSFAYNCLYLNVYTYFLMSENNCEQALSYINDAKKYVHKTKNYPSIEIGILSQEIEILLRLKRFVEAEVKRKAFDDKIAKFFQNSENYYHARNLLYQGWIAMEVKHNYIQAIQNIKQSIDITDRIFHGPDMHIFQPLQHTILGRALECQHKYAEALNEYKQSERIYKKILEQLNGMDDVSVLYQYLTQISLKLKKPDQAKYYLQIHLDLFGADHPRSKSMQQVINDQSKN